MQRGARGCPEGADRVQTGCRQGVVSVRTACSVQRAKRGDRDAPNVADSQAHRFGGVWDGAARRTTTIYVQLAKRWPAFIRETVQCRGVRDKRRCGPERE